MNGITATDLIWYGLAFGTALGLVLYVTPLTIRVAESFKIQDTPDGRLKKHTRPTPYLGGLAIAAGFIISFGLLSTEEVANDKAMGILREIAKEINDSKGKNYYGIGGDHDQLMKSHERMMELSS